jgi:hypothetical protein
MILSFLAIGGEINPNWLVDQPILASCEESYEIITFEPVEKKYRNGSVRDLYINEEKYGLYGVDNTLVTKRLAPVQSFLTEVIDGANGYAKISIRTVSAFPSPEYIYRWDDSRKMKDLYGDIDIPGDYTNVGYGKVMYRTGGQGSIMDSVVLC